MTFRDSVLTVHCGGPLLPLAEPDATGGRSVVGYTATITPGTSIAAVLNEMRREAKLAAVYVECLVQDIWREEVSPSSPEAYDEISLYEAKLMAYQQYEHGETDVGNLLRTARLSIAAQQREPPMVECIGFTASSWHELILDAVQAAWGELYQYHERGKHPFDDGKWGKFFSEPIGQQMQLESAEALRLLQQAPVTPPSPAAPKIAVNLEASQVFFNGLAYALKPDGALMIKALLDAKGDWLSGPSMGLSRADRVRAGLPPLIQSLVESGGPKGFRIPLSRLA